MMTYAVQIKRKTGQRRGEKRRVRIVRVIQKDDINNQH